MVMMTGNNGKESQANKSLSSSQIVDSLRAEASRNPAFNAVAHVFALRERTRGQVTVKALAWTMKKEGFTFPIEAYENIIRVLASLRLGTLDTTTKGKVRGLKNVTVTLQSIGLAAVSRSASLSKFKIKTAFTSLPATSTPVVAPTPVKMPEATYKASIKVTFDGEDIVFDLPDGIGAKELGLFLSKHYRQK